MNSTKSPEKKRGAVASFARDSFVLPFEVAATQIRRSAMLFEMTWENLRTAKDSLVLRGILDRAPAVSFAFAAKQAGLTDEQIVARETHQWFAQASLFLVFLGLTVYAAGLLYWHQSFSAAITGIFAANVFLLQAKAGWVPTMLRERQMLSIRAAIAKGALWPI